MSEAMADTDDKRDNRRYRTFYIGEAETSPADPPIEVNIINLSQGGVGILTKKSLEGRVGIRVIHKSTDEQDRQMYETVWGHVAWKEKVASPAGPLVDELFKIGIEFERFNPKEHSGLLSMLRAAAQE